MRRVVASLGLFLLVTAALLYRTSATDAGTPRATEQAGVAAATAIATQPPTPMPPTSTPMPTEVAPLATASPADAERAPASPTPEPAEFLVATSIPETAIVEETEPEEPTASATQDEPGESYSRDQLAVEHEPAGVLHGDDWDAAIQTIDGGVMGIVLSESANVRTAPSTDAPVVTELHAGWPITLYAAVAGEDVGGNDIWFQTWSGSYISAATVGPFVAPEPEETHIGHWVDVDLTTNYAIAYIDATPVYAAIVITGKAGFETPVGAWSIFRRVELDVLDSATTGIPDGDPESYRLENVPWVQYFADGGFALHANYWSDDWEYGYSRSHGCINFMEEDAAWFWSFLSLGSTVSIHT